MATRKQLEQALNNPNVRKFLDLIAHTEGTEGNGYRTAFGGGRLNSLNDHPRYLKSFKQKNGKTNKTSAAGRYQFLSRTWDGLARQYGLRDFSPHNQDLGAVALLAQNGSLGHILKGDWQTAVKKSGVTWASLPSAPKSYSQPTRSWNNVAKFMGGKGGSSVQQQSQPQADPRLTMSAPELLASLRKGMRSDNEVFMELANNNGRAGREVRHLLDSGNNPAGIAQQLGLNISVAQPQQQVDSANTYEDYMASMFDNEPQSEPTSEGDTFEDYMASMFADETQQRQQQQAPDPIGDTYDDYMSYLTQDEPQQQAGDTWQTQKTSSDSTLSERNAREPQTLKSSWESLS